MSLHGDDEGDDEDKDEKDGEDNDGDDDDDDDDDDDEDSGDGGGDVEDDDDVERVDRNVSLAVVVDVVVAVTSADRGGRRLLGWRRVGRWCRRSRLPSPIGFPNRAPSSRTRQQFSRQRYRLSEDCRTIFFFFFGSQILFFFARVPCSAQSKKNGREKKKRRSLIGAPVPGSSAIAQAATIMPTVRPLPRSAKDTHAGQWPCLRNEPVHRRLVAILCWA